jgi:hypothetical protein
MKVKPILIVRFPQIFTEDQYYLMSELFESKVKDYHVIFIREGEKFVFECFYEKDFNHVKYDELKEIVKIK